MSDHPLASRPRIAATSFLTLLLALCSVPMTAQCNTAWLPGSGTNGAIYASLERDPDGAGPLPTSVLCAGSFTVAGSAAVEGIGYFDPVASSWSELGGGIFGTVRSMIELSNGDVVVGGLLSTVGGVVVSGVARWDGASWSAIGPGLDGTVYALVEMPNGDIVAGGDFFTSGG